MSLAGKRRLTKVLTSQRMGRVDSTAIVLHLALSQSDESDRMRDEIYFIRTGSYKAQTCDNKSIFYGMIL